MAAHGKPLGSTTLIFILLIAIPAVLIVGGAISQAAMLFSGLDFTTLEPSMQGVNNWLEQLIRTFSAGGTPHLGALQLTETIAQVTAWLAGWLRGLVVSLGRALPGIFMNGLVVLVIIFVLLPRYKSPGKQEILEIVPFPTEIYPIVL